MLNDTTPSLSFQILTRTVIEHQEYYHPIHHPLPPPMEWPVHPQAYHPTPLEVAAWKERPMTEPMDLGVTLQIDLGRFKEMRRAFVKTAMQAPYYAKDHRERVSKVVLNLQLDMTPFPALRCHPLRKPNDRGRLEGELSLHCFTEQ